MESSEHSGTMVCPGWGVGHWDSPLQSVFASPGNSKLNIFPSYSHQNHNFHYLRSPSSDTDIQVPEYTCFFFSMTKWPQNTGTRSLVACDVTRAVFRHTLIPSFFSTAIAPVQPAAPIVSNCRTISRDIGPGGRGADIYSSGPGPRSNCPP